MTDLYSELKAVLRALDAARIPYALCGGLALMLYQRPRSTVDIDLVLPADATKALADAVAPIGFQSHPRPMRFDPPGIEILRFYKTDADSSDVLTLDCLLTTHPTVVDAWRGRVEAPFEDGSVPVVSAGGLIALKQLRASPQDLLDIETLQSLKDHETGLGEGNHLA